MQIIKFKCWITIGFCWIQTFTYIHGC